MPHDVNLIATIAVGFVLASIFGYLADRLRLPALVGYLVAGVWVMVTEHLVEHGRVDLIVGTLFVLFHSANRFNTPATNRSSTTAGRFFLAQSVFCLAAVFTYFVLVNFPHLVTLLAAGPPQDQPGYMKELSSPLVMALLMTTLLPRLPLRPRPLLRPLRLPTTRSSLRQPASWPKRMASTRTASLVPARAVA